MFLNTSMWHLIAFICVCGFCSLTKSMFCSYLTGQLSSVRSGFMRYCSLPVSFSSDLSHQQSHSSRIAAHCVILVFGTILSKLKDFWPQKSGLSQGHWGLYLHDCIHCTTATWLAAWIAAWISRCTGAANKRLNHFNLLFIQRWLIFPSGNKQTLKPGWTKGRKMSLSITGYNVWLASS